MAQPTYTRAEIRKEICSRLNMRFFKYFEESSTSTGGNASVLVDSNLTQKADYWNGSWLYPISGSPSGDIRYIEDFGGGSITPDRNLSGLVGAVTKYQILDRFTPQEIHRAIDEAILEGYPAFFGIATDESLIVQEDKMEYDLTGLSQVPWRVYQVWIERNGGTIISGEVASATALTLVAGSSLSAASAGWLVGIYDGTGSGQLRTVQSVSGSEITNTAIWTTNPDTTSRFTLWNPDDQRVQWYQMNSLHFDASEYPSKLYLHGIWPDAYGMRIRLVYTYEPSELTTDASTTTVPKKYIIAKALAILFGQRIDRSSADRTRYRNLADAREQEAELYKQMRAFTPPNMTLWQTRDSSESTWQDRIDPLNTGY